MIASFIKIDKENTSYGQTMTSGQIIFSNAADMQSTSL